MKIDRLLKIVIYLLNHENVSARDLAERLFCSHHTERHGQYCRSRDSCIFQSGKGWRILHFAVV